LYSTVTEESRRSSIFREGGRTRQNSVQGFISVSGERFTICGLIKKVLEEEEGSSRYTMEASTPHCWAASPTAFSALQVDFSLDARVLRAVELKAAVGTSAAGLRSTGSGYLPMVKDEPGNCAASSRLNSHRCVDWKDGSGELSVARSGEGRIVKPTVVEAMVVKPRREIEDRHDRERAGVKKMEMRSTTKAARSELGPS